MLLLSLNCTIEGQNDNFSDKYLKVLFSFKSGDSDFTVLRCTQNPHVTGQAAALFFFFFFNLTVHVNIQNSTAI